MTATPEPLAGCGASCALWREAPSHDGRRTAAIGRFACDTAEAGAALLDEACLRLGAEGFDAVIGPMDGDTWHSYRLVTLSEARKPFFLEPANPPHFVAAFEQAGFASIASYVSLIDNKLAANPRIIRPQGVMVRTWRRSEPEAELARIHEISLKAFARNAFYRPIGREEFLSLYLPVVPLIDPELVLFAETAQREPLGFLFALPDRLEGPRPTTVILKTYASLKRGIGGLLGDVFYDALRARGYASIIHALVHVDNLSLKHSESRHGEVFRRYALFARRLTT